MKYLIILFVLLFTACSTKNYEHTQTKVIIIKSPLLKFSDLGYIRNTDDSLSLELFSAGQRVEEITINNLVCVTKGCMSKSGFNEEYLNEKYPDEILQNIILARPIFNSRNLIKTKNGFEQKIVNENFFIIYRVSSNQTYFKDKRNNILLKIKDTK
ncbi:MAG: hypothetical protein DRG78_11890 [Epsilonproteobacteria bacterium]|nr:MAG: hypothetical protein DRG78_11890 [Campylobacterota bacterium]